MAVVILKGMLYGINWRRVPSLYVALGRRILLLAIRVINAPRDFPDGIYTLVSEAKTYATEKRQGWGLMVLTQRECA